MELDEMKNLWQKMSQKIDKQKHLTNKLIMDMTQERYTNRFNTISTYETIGAVICLVMAFTVIINFGKLDTWYLIACGTFTAAYLLILPILSLNALHRIKRVNISGNSYKETLIAFAKAKKQLLLVQKSGIYLNFILMFITIPLASKILNNKNIFLGSNHWLWFIPIFVLFLVIFSRWGYQCYKNITNSAENILKELED